MADEGHISLEAMERFLSSRASRREAHQVVAHLIAGCDECTGLARRLLSEGTGSWYPKRGEPATVEQFNEMFDRVFAAGTAEVRRLAVEKLQGWAQWATLDPLLPEERMTRVLRDPGMWTWGLHERLIEASRWYGRNDPQEAVDIVRLALVVAQFIDYAKLGGKERHQDLIAETLALLGNAQRLASDFEGARQSFNGAWAHQDQGTGDPLTQAHITRLEASWMIDMGEFEAAEAVLEEAAALCREVGDREQEARTLLRKGVAIGLADAEGGVRQIRQALPLIDAEQQPRTYLCAQHDLAWFLAEAGQSNEALEILEETRRLFRQFPDEYAQLRLHWLEGKIARSMGRLDEAVSIFRQLLDELNARTLKHEIVLVTLDLAEAMSEGHQYEDAASLVRELYPLMATWGLHRWALAAALLLENALRLRELDGIFLRIRAYYRRYWNREVELPPE